MPSPGSVARLAVLVGAVASVTCCGGSPAARRSAAAPAPPPAQPAIAPCVPAARDAVASAAGAGAVTSLTTGVAPGEATCVYRGSGLRVHVHIDANPQAAVRFDRAVVERDQVAVWSHRPGHAPRLLKRLGQGADWFPADRELLTTDGRRLVSVLLVRPPHRRGAALRLARRVARATLDAGG